MQKESGNPGGRRAALAAAVALLAGCAEVGLFTWADAYGGGTEAEAGYVIAAGDLLQVRVYNQDSMSSRVRVRNDGMISLPFLNDVEAAGLPPAELARRLQEKLKDLFVSPVVTVSLEEARLLEISVVGEIVRTGIYRLEPGAGVLTAVASAGGLNEYARRDRIFVLRPEAGPDGRTRVARIRFTYEALARATGRAATFRLRNGDTVVVE